MPIYSASLDPDGTPFFTSISGVLIFFMLTTLIGMVAWIGRGIIKRLDQHDEQFAANTKLNNDTAVTLAAVNERLRGHIQVSDDDREKLLRKGIL